MTCIIVKSKCKGFYMQLNRKVKKKIKTSCLVGGFADATEGFFSWTLHWFFGWLLRSFINYKFFALFLLVSVYRQTELATKVHECAVFCWDCDHVPWLKDLPANRAEGRINADHWFSNATQLSGDTKFASNWLRSASLCLLPRNHKLQNTN